MNQVEYLSLMSLDMPLMQIKQKLLYWKRNGDIFTPDDLSRLKVDDPIEIYFALTPGDITYRNAFPVLIEKFGYYPKDMAGYNRYYYHQYYLNDQYHSEDFYLAYKPYNVTKKWVWYYKGCALDC
jgi:hypothetical protein